MPTLLFSATVAGDINIKVLKPSTRAFISSTVRGSVSMSPTLRGWSVVEESNSIATLLFFATINENDFNMDTFCGFVAAISH